jgi:hypothetical protein
MNVDAGNLLAEPNRRPINDIHFRIEGPVFPNFRRRRRFCPNLPPSAEFDYERRSLGSR